MRLTLAIGDEAPACAGGNRAGLGRRRRGAPARVTLRLEVYRSDVAVSSLSIDCKYTTGQDRYPEGARQ